MRVLRLGLAPLLLAYAAFLCVRPRWKPVDPALLRNFRYFFSHEAYNAVPFVMFVNAVLHTVCADLIRRLSNAPPKPSVELGAGEGSFAESVFEAKQLSVLSSVMPSDAKHLRKRAVAERAAIIDAEYLPFEPGSLRFVLLMDTLYHIGDQDRAIREVARALQPGGCLAFNYIAPECFTRCLPSQRLFSLLGLGSRQERDLREIQRHMWIDSLHPAAEIRALLEKNDLEVVEERPIASVEVMRKAYTMFWASMHAAPGLLHRIAHGKVASRIIERLVSWVFPPMVADDEKACARSGATYTWFIARKRSGPTASDGSPVFVCPLCKGKLDGAIRCEACRRTYPLVDEVPVFLVHDLPGLYASSGWEEEP